MALPFVAAPPPGTPGGFTGVPTGGERGSKTYQWVIGWILLIALLALANQTETGHTVIYYALVLVLVFLLVTQYSFIAGALAPVGEKAPASG